MVYVIEGPDGVGKSTVMKALKKIMPEAVFVKESYTPSIDERIKRVGVFRDYLLSNKTVVYDRATVVDDFVYEPVVAKQKSHLSEPVIQQLLHCATIVYIDCDVKILEKRLASRGDEYIEAHHVPLIKEQYEKFFERNFLHVHRVDGSRPICNVIREVVKIVDRKSFKVAHIVPVGSLSKTLEKGYHMCLANIVKKNKEYTEHFRNLAHDGKHWVLMDNGAAEGEQLSVEELIECYQVINPNEVVLPDTLLDSVDTLRKSKKALEQICDFYDGAVPFTFMAVPQGKTLDEWEQCARVMIQWPEVKSIGISKFLQMETGETSARWDAAVALDKLIKEFKRYDVEVHLLGCSETPETIGYIRHRFAFVRGCDSAYTYLCSQAGEKIYPCTERPEGEIDFIDGKDYTSLEDNMVRFEESVGIVDNKFDRTWE